MISGDGFENWKAMDMFPILRREALERSPKIISKSIRSMDGPTICCQSWHGFCMVFAASVICDWIDEVPSREHIPPCQNEHHLHNYQFPIGDMWSFPAYTQTVAVCEASTFWIWTWHYLVIQLLSPSSSWCDGSKCSWDIHARDALALCFDVSFIAGNCTLLITTNNLPVK